MPDYHACQLPQATRPPRRWRCWMCGNEYMSIRTVLKIGNRYRWVRVWQ